MHSIGHAPNTRFRKAPRSRALSLHRPNAHRRSHDAHANGDGTTSPRDALRIVGALDALTVPQVEAMIEEVLAAHPARVVVDFNDLWLIDSSGIGAIVSLYRRVRADGGEFVVVGAHDQPLAILRLLKLDRVFGL